MSSLLKYITVAFTITIISCHQRSKNFSPDLPRKKISIALLPYNGFDTTLIGNIQSEIEQFYNCKCILLKQTAIPSFAFYSTRNRYKADSILVFEKRQATNDEIIVGLTDKDISTSKGSIADWGVLGLGYCPGQSSIISTYRMQRNLISEELFKSRLIKIILHELGHNFGLPHCKNDPRCIMNDAEGLIATVDRERKWLCDNCRHKIGL